MFKLDVLFEAVIFDSFLEVCEDFRRGAVADY
jgi:hypothetical protein